MGMTPGVRVGPYEILAPLGAGGMGEVWRARDPRLGRDVALKVLPAEVGKDAERLRRFEQEARAAGALNHPNVLVVYDVGEHEGVPHIATELLDGASLRDRLRHGPLPPSKALDYATQIARGLAAAHAKGIVHRDLKPENLFVTRDGRVKILDFGLAKSLVGDVSPLESTLAETQPGVVLGTAGYMAPEQVRGRPADARADIFAFGAVLYEMLVGKRAFDGDSHVERAHAILTKEPPELTASGVHVPPAVERVLRRCLEKAPEERFQSARDLGFALEALSDTSAAGVSGARPAAALGAARRAARIAGLAALLIALGVGSVFLGRWQGRRQVRAVGVPATPPAARPADAPRFTRVTFRRTLGIHARFAPDGRSVVYSALLDDEPMRIYAATLGFPEARPLAKPVSVIHDMSPRGDMLIDYGPTDGAAPEMIYRAALAGGEPRAVHDDAAYAEWGPDGETPMFVRVGGGKQWIEYPRGKVVFKTDLGQITNARFSPAGDLLAFQHITGEFGEAKGSLMVVDVRTGAPRRLVPDWPGIGGGLAWAPGGREVWFGGRRTDDEPPTLWAVDLEGHTRRVLETGTLLIVYDIAPDGRVLLARADIRFRTAGLVPGRPGQVDLSWFDQSTVADLSADGKLILFNEGGEAYHEHGEVFLRKTSGEPPVRLATGQGFALSPDGAWALVSPARPNRRLELVPTGPGETRALPPGPFDYIYQATFFPDGKRVLIRAQEPGRGARLWVQALAGGPPRPISEEGFSLTAPPSPDGAFVPACRPPAGCMLVPVAGGKPRPLPDLGSGQGAPIGWTANGRGLIACRGTPRRGGFPIQVFSYDLTTRAKHPLHTLMPPDPVQANIGPFGPENIRVSPDGRHYAFPYLVETDDLFVVAGLR